MKGRRKAWERMLRNREEEFDCMKGIERLLKGARKGKTIKGEK